MLLRTVFLLALIAVLAETIAHGAAALARASLHERALAAARAQFAAALTLAQDAVATSMQQPLASTIVLPAPSPTCAATTSTGCALTATTSLTLANVTPAAPASSGCPQTDCTVYLESNDLVREGRVSVEIATTITAPDGSTLARRAATVAMRTFRVAPYAALVGTLDATLDDVAANGTGDDGGANTSAPTLINVLYENNANPAATPLPGNVWQTQLQHPATLSSPWDH